MLAPAFGNFDRRRWAEDVSRRQKQRQLSGRTQDLLPDSISLDGVRFVGGQQ